MYTSISDNIYYPTICKLASENDYYFNNFKSNSAYTAILEHTSVAQAELYFKEIRNKNISEKDINTLAKKIQINDKFGGTKTYQFNIDGEYVELSPSSVRYLFVALDLINKFGSFKNKKICEIGGGYGGQCTIMNAIDGFDRWDILDLEEANLLQKRYLTNLNISNTNVYNLNTIDNVLNQYDVVISNYAFSECKKSIQDVYIEKIISKANNGYMLMNFCWDDASQGFGWEKQNGYENMISESDFIKLIKNLKIEKEIPETHPKNKLYWW